MKRYYSKPWREKDPRTGHYNVRWRSWSLDQFGNRIDEKKHSISCGDDYPLSEKTLDRKKAELKLANLGEVNPNAELMKLYQGYIQDRRSMGQRESSLEIKKYAIVPLVERVQSLGDLTRDSLRKHREWLLAKYDQPTTVSMNLRAIRAFCNWLVSQDHLKETPFIKIEIPRPQPMPRFLSDEELVAIDVCAKGQMLAILRMAYLTGARRMEILEARWENISWLGGRAYWTINWSTTKTKRSRTIALRQEVVEALGARRPSGRIFDGWNQDRLRREWDSVKERARLSGRIRFHDLRHTFCKLYLQGGGTIADLMQITGHTDIHMMQIYAHFESRYKAERIDAMNLPPVIRGQLQARPENVIDVPNPQGSTGQNQEPPAPAEGANGA